MPRLPQRVCGCFFPTAAGYGDFCHQLKNNPGGFTSIRNFSGIDAGWSCWRIRFVNFGQDKFPFGQFWCSSYYPGRWGNFRPFRIWYLSARGCLLRSFLCRYHGYRTRTRWYGSRFRGPYPCQDSTAAAEFLIDCMNEAADEWNRWLPAYAMVSEFAGYKQQQVSIIQESYSLCCLWLHFGCKINFYFTVRKTLYKL